MYTEDEEFDYNSYLDEDDVKETNKPLIDIRFILRIALIVLLVILIIFLVFKIKNKNTNKVNKQPVITSEIVSSVFDENMNKFKDAAYDYFFKKGNLPKNVGDSREVTLKKLVDSGLVTKVVDTTKKTCAYNTSNAMITKNKNNYKMEIKLVCSDKSDSVIYYYDLDGKCLNCNGENYDPNKEEKEETKKDTFIDDKTDKVPTTKVCKDFSKWSTVYVAGNNYEVETRKVVKAYKTETVYGKWSNPTTKKITATDKLEVKSYTDTETIETKTDWSELSTSKPKSKEGREIKSTTKQKKYTTESCTEGSTYTRTLTKWDNSAYKCITLGIGKYKCTYKTEGTCKTVTKYKNVKYYKYRDTVEEEVETIYYQSRTVNKKTVYTDYILESEIPEGYTKLKNSEITQYRYREKCNK